MADTYDDPLFGDPGSDARAMAMRRLGGLLQMSGDKALAPAGKGMVDEADTLRQIQLTAPQRSMAATQARRAAEEEQAWHDPMARKVLTGALRSFMPQLDVDENTPTAVLRNILPTAEKFGQSYNALALRQSLQNKFQQKQDPNTGELYLLNPYDGSTYHMDGSPRTHGVTRPTPALLGGAPRPVSPQPSEAPAEEPTGPRAPTLVTAADREPVRALAPKKLSRGPAPGPTVAAPPTPAPSSAPGPTPSVPRGLSQPMMGRVLDKANQAFGNDLDPNKGTGEVQKNQARLNAAIRLRALVTNEDGTIKDNIPPQFMKEVAVALAQLTSNGGQPAQSLIEELTPRTKSSKFADWMQWITDNPQDAGQQGFVKLYLESANREAVKAQEALNKAVSSRVGKHQRLIRGNPDVAVQTARSFGWNLDPDKMTMTPIDAPEVAAGAKEKEAPKTEQKPAPDREALRKKYGL